MIEQVGNGISQSHSPLGHFAEFYICSVKIITLGNLESHFLIINFCFCGQDKQSPFLKIKLFSVIPKKNIPALCLLLDSFKEITSE